jgi:hypothetical protein
MAQSMAEAAASPGLCPAAVAAAATAGAAAYCSSGSGRKGWRLTAAQGAETEAAAGAGATAAAAAAAATTRQWRRGVLSVRSERSARGRGACSRNVSLRGNRAAADLPRPCLRLGPGERGRAC